MRQASKAVKETMDGLLRQEPATGLNIGHAFPTASAMTIGEDLEA
jgi:hypothetical protein